MKNTIKYLVQSGIFKLRNRIFRQISRNPMGSEPALFFANLFLYYYESNGIDS